MDDAKKEIAVLQEKVDSSQQKIKQNDEKYLKSKQDWNNKYEELLTEKEKMGKEWQVSVSISYSLIRKENNSSYFSFTLETTTKYSTE